MNVIGIADSDSYVKWAAALLSSAPDSWTVRLVIVRTAKEPSVGQLDSALVGSSLRREDVTILPFEEAIAEVAKGRPDAVLVATIGPLADIVTEAVLDACASRPVVFSGLPGIALPARRKALIYRSQVDLVVLHSIREMRRFAAIAAENGFDHRFALATFPFLEAPGDRLEPSGDVIFAAQAIVPASMRDRVLLLSWLVLLARAEPERRVVVKVRAVGSEAQTHAETDSYAELLARKFSGAPANLVVEAGPMSEHLARASALVTISSTAALEAVALGVPTLVLDEFGISPDLINEVFVGSGLMGSADDLVASRFNSPREAWLQDNYFHAPERNSWSEELVDLVAANRAVPLPYRPRVVRGMGGALRRAWDKRQALGPFDRSPLGAVAIIVGTPARWVVLIRQRVVRLAQRALGRPSSADPPASRSRRSGAIT